MKREQFYIEAVNKMMETAGYSERYEDLLDDPDWLDKYTWTPEQSEEFKAWFISTIRKRLHVPKYLAERHYAWFNLDVGLREN
jgi:hypothetical protein